jgi:DNA helicase-4
MKSEQIREIVRGSLVGGFLRLFGHRHRGIALSEGELVLLARSPKSHHLSDIVSATRISKVLGFTAIAVTVRDGTEVKVAGLKRSEATAFVVRLNAAWQSHFAKQVGVEEAELSALAETINRLKHPRRYPSACLVEPFFNRADRVFNRLPTTIPDGVLDLSRFDAAPLIAFTATKEMNYETDPNGRIP